MNSADLSKMCVEISFLQNIEILGHNCSKNFYSDSLKHDKYHKSWLYDKFEDLFKLLIDDVFLNDNKVGIFSFLTSFVDLEQLTCLII